MKLFVFGLMILVIFWDVNLFANPLQCANLLDPEIRYAETKTQKQFSSILKKLDQLFGPHWQENNNDFDHTSAQLIFKQLKQFGSPIDLEIFETYITILLNTEGPFDLREQGLFYIDSHLGERPKSTHFRELHWDWSIFIGYFSTTPSVLNFTKAKDLDYLREILKQCTQQNLLKQKKVTLPEVLVMANRNWHLHALQKIEPQLAKAFTNYLALEPRPLTAKTAYTQRYLTFVKKVEAFKAKAQQKYLDVEFGKHLDEALSYFKNSHSEFDLFIFEKYFDLISQMPFNEALAQAQTDKTLQLTHWQVFYHGLPFGSVEYFTDFLFQNSHDTAMKTHLLKILNAMQDLLDRKYLDEIYDPKNVFFSTFTLARTYVENDIEQIPAPKIYQSDLRIFTVNADFSVSTKLQGHTIPRMAFPRYDEVLVSWNPFLGKLHANVIRSYSLQSEDTPKVGVLKKLREYFKVYFDTLRHNQTVPEEWINEFEREEMDSTLARSTIFAFTEPHTEKLLALVRVFDGSQMEFYHAQDQLRYDHDDNRLPIKHAFPEISLPELQNFEHVLEIGRVLATKDIIANSYDTMMARIADYFNVRGMKGIIYLSSPAAMARYNQRKGASVVYTPEQLAKNPQDMDSVYILKITIDDFVKKFLRPEYDSVQLRETPHSR